MTEQKLVCDKCGNKEFYIMLFKEDKESEFFNDWCHKCTDCGILLRLEPEKKTVVH